MALPATPQLIMRVSAAAVYFFDYLMTVPSEYRMYKRQKKMTNPSAACVLFILSRYVTLVSIAMATAFFFGTHWTTHTCVPAIGGALRALSASIVSIIFMWRTWAIYHKSRPILYFLMVVFIPTTVFTWGFVFNQVPLVKAGSCGGLAGPGVFGAKWPFALANIVFDATCVGLSTFRLVVNLNDGSSQISSILLVDGLAYFFASVALQVLNFIFLVSSDPTKQNTMITFTNAVTGLLSQRIITSLSQRIVSYASASNESYAARNTSLSRWMDGAGGRRRGPGISTGGTGTGMEMNVAISVTKNTVTDADVGYGDHDAEMSDIDVKRGGPV
ncbi:hypothetical protein C8R47DRAFT_704267 [Mycena vitilis]|nr:hypothetical protein C8R47DRAFT_704267 [Mycena vitilis]